MTYASQKRRVRRDRKSGPSVTFTVHVVSTLDSAVTACGKRIGSPAKGWQLHDSIEAHDRLCQSLACTAERRRLGVREL